MTKTRPRCRFLPNRSPHGADSGVAAYDDMWEAEAVACGTCRGGRRGEVVPFFGGLGVRMRESATSLVPKPMPMVGERPLLWHVMRYYAYFGHTDFILCLGYGAT